MSRGLKLRCEKLLEQRWGIFQFGNFPGNLIEEQAFTYFYLLNEWFVGQLLSHWEFWQNNASSLHWSLVNVYFMKLEIYPSYLPRFFLLSWKSSLGDDRNVYQLQKGNTASPDGLAVGKSYQLTAQEVKGQWPSLMSMSRIRNKWHCQSLKPFLASPHLCWRSFLPCHALMTGCKWYTTLPEKWLCPCSPTRMVWGIILGRSTPTLSVLPELHELTVRKSLLGVRNKWGSLLF